MLKVYLATPYSAKSEHLEDQRFEFISRLAGRFVSEDINCFSPITNSHLLHKYGPNNIPGNWSFWKEIDFSYIDWCEVLYVACIKGWEKSVGVTAEIEYALETGKTVVKLPCDLAVKYMRGDVDIFL